MNDLQITVLALSSLVSLAGCWVLLFWFYRDFCVDRFRQEVFALRDELFDLAASGAVPFDHPLYGMLRSMMNGYIRFGHRLSLLQFLLFAVFRGRENSMRSGNWFRDRFEEEIRSVDATAGIEIRRIRSRLEQAVVKHVFLSSPILVAMLVPPLILLVGVTFFGAYLMAQLRAHIDRIDSAAVAFGNHEPAAA